MAYISRIIRESRGVVEMEQMELDSFVKKERTRRFKAFELLLWANFKDRHNYKCPFCAAPLNGIQDGQGHMAGSCMIREPQSPVAPIIVAS